jgi:regulatory protein
MELRQKGIDNETIDNILQDLDEEDLALRAASKQARKYDGLEWSDFRKKLSAFLARRGFGYDVVSPVVREVWSELYEDV